MYKKHILDIKMIWNYSNTIVEQKTIQIADSLAKLIIVMPYVFSD